MAVNPDRKIRECSNPTCHLEALWQIGFKFSPRWIDDSNSALYGWTSFLVCGMCKDGVALDQFGDRPQALADHIMNGHGDALRIELTFIDISEGKWINPQRPTVLSAL